MKTFFPFVGGIFLAYSVAGIILHLLAKMEILNHYCELLLLAPEDNHLQIFTLTAAIAAVLFQIARKKKRKQVEKPVG